MFKVVYTLNRSYLGVKPKDCGFFSSEENAKFAIDNKRRSALIFLYKNGCSNPKWVMESHGQFTIVRVPHDSTMLDLGGDNNTYVSAEEFELAKKECLDKAARKKLEHERLEREQKEKRKAKRAKRAKH